MERKIIRAIRHYKYDEILEADSGSADFLYSYDFHTSKNNLRRYPSAIWCCLERAPNCNHIKAKNLLFQENDECWKYFERTAVFLTYSHFNDEWIDHLKGAYEYALYVERDDLLHKLIEISMSYLTDESNLASKEFKKQRVYPSTQLVHFLIEKWLGYNPAKELILNYGQGYGNYQKLIDHWEDFSAIEPSYWDELCEYHLNAIGLQRGEKWENQEFLFVGLAPIELINLIKVRKKLGLDIPTISNELFSTSMAKEPTIPTGYSEELDVKFQLVVLTARDKRKYTVEEVIEHIKEVHGDDAEVFL